MFENSFRHMTQKERLPLEAAYGACLEQKNKNQNC